MSTDAAPAVNPAWLRAVADALQARMVDELKQLYKDAVIATYEGKTATAPNAFDYATRLLSPKLSVDESSVRIGPALAPRVYYAGVAPVIAEMIACSDARGKPSMLQAGVWIEKTAFKIEFFAWIEVFIPKVNA